MTLQRVAVLQYSTDHQVTWQDAGPRSSVEHNPMQPDGDAWSSHYPHPLPGSATATDWRILVRDEGTAG